MLLKKNTLLKLIKEGKADYTGGTAEESVVRDNDKRYVAVNRFDAQRVDHYEI